MVNFEESIREIVKQELEKHASKPSLQPVAKFCEDFGLSRVTVWRGEKQGRWKLHRIGKKVFVDPASIAK